jgi:hypothetical protein
MKGSGERRRVLDKNSYEMEKMVKKFHKLFGMKLIKKWEGVNDGEQSC